MCGIAGIFSYRNAAPPVDREELTAIRDAMAARGPDGVGLWVSPGQRVGFGHRRLSIIDLSNGGDQPMLTPDQGLAIVFNGEIYNYQALRKTLEGRGHTFRSTSDTEVLLYAYLEYGESMVHQLRGMYAFAIWRESDQSLFMARDPFGIKPLYYSDDGYALRFASQVKALTTSPAISSAPDPAGHAGFFLWGSVPEPFTLYESIRCLPAGSTLTLSRSRPARVAAFFNVRDEMESAVDAARGSVLPAMQLRELMLDSVRHHMIADVPVGLFLSSGIDSTAITALASELSRDTLNTVTLGFEEFRNTGMDETTLAAQYAAAYGVKRNTAWIGRDQFARSLDHMFAAMDQPTIDGVNTYLVSQAAAQAGMKVALSGLGGDELFGGYPSFRDVPRSVRNTAALARIPGLGRGFRAVTAPWLRHFTSPKYAGLLEYGGRYEGAYLLRRGLFMPWELPEVLEPEMAREGWARLETMARLSASVPERASPFGKVSALELSWYMRSQLLRDSDWAGMAHSLEIRVPMVDAALFRQLAPYVAQGTAPGKRELALACVGDRAQTLIARAKSGFAVPVERWMNELKLAEDTDRGLRGWAKTVYARHHPRSPKYAKERVLVFRVGNLGDTLVSLPAIAKIRERHPAASLCLLTNAAPSKPQHISTWAVVKPLQYFDHAIHYVSHPKRLAQLNELLALTVKLRDFSPQRAYYLSPKRSNWQQQRDAFFFRKLLAIDDFIQLPETELPPKDAQGNLPRLTPEWQRLHRIADADASDVYRLKIPARDRQCALEVLADFRIDGSTPLVAVGPGSKMPAKIWAADNFKALGTRILASDPQARLVVLGGWEDQAIGDVLCAAWGARSLNLAGKLSILESAAVLEHCRLYVGNDTGTMHLAAMVGVRCVAIFSARDYPGLWEPYGEDHAVIRREQPCSGCMLEVCTARRNKCLTDITIDEVFSAVQRGLHAG